MITFNDISTFEGWNPITDPTGKSVSKETLRRFVKAGEVAESLLHNQEFQTMIRYLYFDTGLDNDQAVQGDRETIAEFMQRKFIMDQVKKVYIETPDKLTHIINKGKAAKKLLNK